MKKVYIYSTVGLIIFILVYLVIPHDEKFISTVVKQKINLTSVSTRNIFKTVSSSEFKEQIATSENYQSTGDELLWCLPIEGFDGYQAIIELRHQAGYSSSYGEYHNGSDIDDLDSISNNAYILSPVDGTVQTAAYSSSAGNWVVIKSTDGYTIKLMHMAELPLVVAGDDVKAGTRVGIIGTTGQSTGEHLHYQVEMTGSVLNPYTLDPISRDTTKGEAPTSLSNLRFFTTSNVSIIKTPSLDNTSVALPQNPMLRDYQVVANKDGYKPTVEEYD